MSISQLLTAPRSEGRPLVVGTIHQSESLQVAVRLAPGAVDLLEWRLDALHPPACSDPARHLPPALPIPMLLTIRHPAEGGHHDWPTAARRMAYEALLPYAALIDVELRSWHLLAGVRAMATERGIPVVASFHDFHDTPPLSLLRKKIRHAFSQGASLVKIASTLRSLGELDRLARLLIETDRPLAVMGMGPLGQTSRLVLAGLGSRLNYGYLASAQVPGQWEAVVFKQRLQEMGCLASGLLSA